VAAAAPAMRAVAERAVAAWPVGQPVALHALLSRLSLDVILGHLLGDAASREAAAIGDALFALLHRGPFSLRFFDKQGTAAALSAYRDDVAALDELLAAAIAARRSRPDRVPGNLVQQGGLG